MAQRRCYLGVVVFGLLTAQATLQAQTPLPWSDNFESYTNGTVLHNVNGWRGWPNNPAFAASTTTSPPAPLPNSAVLIDGTDDAVVSFTPATSGRWVVQFKQYIPSAFTGTTYFILLNQYDDACVSCNWSTQVSFEGASGNMVDTGIGTTTQPFLTDQWVDVTIEIDLGADTQRMLYNGAEFYSGSWSGHVSGGGSTQIAALDLFANGSTAVYYDNIVVGELLPSPLPWSDSFESYTTGTVVNGINGWRGWTGNSAFAASTTNAPPAPLPNSALRIEGSDDALVQFDPPTGGKWYVNFKQYIPSSFSGTTYIIMLNQYDDACVSCNWSVQVSFDGTSGNMDDTGVGLSSQPFLTDQWVYITIEIDLDADTQRMLYNGAEFYSGTWSGHVSGGGSTEIGALDLFANASSVVYYDDFSIAEYAPASLPWSDDFETYADGSVLNVLNGWQGWFNNPSLAASTTTSPPAPLPNSAAVIAGDDDTIVPFMPSGSGQWVVRFKQYIPAAFTGTTYFIMLNQYDDACVSCNWSVQVNFDGATGNMTDDGVGLSSQPFLTDQWVDVMFEIDLDGDTQRMLYNGSEFYSGSWSGHVSGGGSTEIRAINLYANGSSAVYYDDFMIEATVLPVELTSFDAMADNGNVILTWSTASELNNAGFSVQQRAGEDQGGQFLEIGYVDGQGTTNEPQEYRFELKDVEPGVHRFRLKQIDFDGAFEYSGEVEIAVTLAGRAWIEPAHPNPFSNRTNLRFAVPADQHVSVSLYDIRGQLVRRLFDGPVAADRSQFLTIDAAGLSSGTYLVSIRGAGFSETERILLLK